MTMINDELERDLRWFLERLDSDFDCDTNGNNHKYNCRACKAKELLSRFPDIQLTDFQKRIVEVIKNSGQHSVNITTLGGKLKSNNLAVSKACASLDAKGVIWTSRSTPDQYGSLIYGLRK